MLFPGLGSLHKKNMIVDNKINVYLNLRLFTAWFNLKQQNVLDFINKKLFWKLDKPFDLIKGYRVLYINVVYKLRFYAF